ncbi:DUF1844 domain-containing protein [Candidatus Bathyarchaeota archaeon]|nr:DUF1844 domain-containing protein [Candidatus Bathyarchaeota archaeon]
MSDEFQQIDLLDLEIEEIFRFFIGLTSNKALQYLGISLKEGETVEKDLVRSRLAIDITDYLVKKMDPYLEDEEETHLKQMVSNLQFTYFRESN